MTFEVWQAINVVVEKWVDWIEGQIAGCLLPSNVQETRLSIVFHRHLRLLCQNSQMGLRLY